jgi:hypothetical protein
MMVLAVVVLLGGAGRGGSRVNGAGVESGAEVSAEPAPAEASYDWEKYRREHWSFRPVRKPLPPDVRESAWVSNPIDRFILDRLEQAGLKPSPPADRRTLVRRVYLDLIGLPPSPEEVQEFLDDRAPDAFEKVVESLLSSPRYGERWGRFWLDTARYSDGLGGFLDNRALPQAWRFRDWVVDAWNRDRPYDEFVQAQIAGDLTDPEHDGRATGFFAMGPTYISDGGDPEAKAQAEAETLSDRVDTFARGFLGLTAACARCHDHKFDPITTADYYAMAGIFRNSDVADVPLVPGEVVGRYKEAQELIRAQNEKIRAFVKDQAQRLGVKESEVEKQPGDGLQAELDELREELERRKAASPPQFPTAHCLVDSGSEDMHIAIRGDLRRKGERAPRRFLQILAGEGAPPFDQGSGRRQLAKAVVDPGNPLTARVMVNRIWLQHFGGALVESPSNFGVIGEKPSHPELLDWLAATFVESGWSIKRLHRIILGSSTWRMSSGAVAGNMTVDAGNRLLWRMNPRKMDVEAWRDSLLQVTGELETGLGGVPTEHLLESRRRTLYAKISRNGDRFESDEFLRLFDFPMPRATSPKRVQSTVPQQYLFMMNSPFMIGRAGALVGRLERERDGDAARIDRAYELLYGRVPSGRERDLGIAFLSAVVQSQDQPMTPWQQYAQVLLSAHEFMQIQ